MRQAYLVTTYLNGKSRSRVWSGARPMQLDFDPEWQLVRGQDEVRVEKRAGGSNVKPLVIGRQMISSGSKVRIDHLSAAIQVEPIKQLAPVYQLHADDTSNTPSSNDVAQWMVYHSLGQMIVDAIPVGKKYTAEVDSAVPFRIEAKGDGLIVASKAENVAIVDAKGRKQPLARGERAEISDPLHSTIEWDGHIWRVNRARKLPPLQDEKRRDEVAPIYGRILVSGMLSVLALLIASHWLAKPEKVEVETKIPPEYVKLMLRDLPSRSQGLAQEANEAEAQTPAAQAPSKEVAKAKVEPQPEKAVQVAKNTPAKPQAKSKPNPVVAQKPVVTQKSRALMKLMHSGLLAMNAGPAQSSRILAAAQANSDSAAKLDAGSASRAADLELKAQAVQGAGSVAGIGDSKSANGVSYSKGVHAGLSKGKSGTGNQGVVLDTGGATMEAGLTKDEVGAVIYKHMAEIRYCYESAMLAQNRVEGRMIVDFSISGIGLVKKGKVNQSSLSDQKLESCVLRRLMTWKFPTPKGGVTVDVSYPFIFRTLRGA